MRENAEVVPGKIVSPALEQQNHKNEGNVKVVPDGKETSFFTAETQLRPYKAFSAYSGKQ